MKKMKKTFAACGFCTRQA